MNDPDDAPSDGGTPTDGDVPRIVVRRPDPEGPLIEHVERGIEEEGVPWVIQAVEADDSDPDHRRDGPTATAHRAASDSGLEIGIGVSDEGDLVLHHARLADDEPLISIANATAPEARTVGTNAARLAKRMPLKPLD